ncbi:TPA: hypothetical protein R4Q56_000771 [Pseudomonas aeruginosa]|nr:hypothetical protein [Pseudomonas aeruginosa]HBP5172994.1 hypothetical protein [Pseudomonas aeruginosa]HED1674394.1 hypothetical protein [Pseudomonas aeruginosa]
MMTISKRVFAALLIGVGFGGAVVSRLVISPSSECAVIADKIGKGDAAEEEFRRRSSQRGPSEGF